MKKEDALQSKVIEFLRFPLIIGVVISHAFLEGIHGVNVPQEGLPVYHHLSFLLSRVLSFIAVPLFFFISGYLFFYRTDFSMLTYRHKLKSRVRTLLIPFLFWNLFILACHWIVFLFSPIKLTSGAYKLVVDYTWIDYLRVFWDIKGVMPINGALWFIRDLIIMVVCAPLVYWVLRYLRWYVFLLLGGLWLVNVDLYIPNLAAIFFFTLGAWFSINKRNFVDDFKPFFPWGCVLYGCLAVITLFYRDLSTYASIHRATILVGIVACISLTTFFVNKGKWKSVAWLTGSSFFVYAFHQLPMNAIVRVYCKWLSPQSDWEYLAIYIISPIIIVSFNLLIYAILRKCFPRVTNFITGGRS